MRRSFCCPALLLCGAIFSSACQAEPLQLQAGSVPITLTDQGMIARLAGPEGEFQAEPLPLLQLQTTEQGSLLSPRRLQVTQRNSDRTSVTLEYAEGVSAQLELTEHDRYLALKLQSVQAPEGVQKVVWGPYRTTLADPPGCIAGILRQNDFAFVLQTLNSKTVGGRDDVRPTRDNFTARVTPNGSQLEAFSCDRTQPDTRDAWSSRLVDVQPVPGETVAGSAIALFGCSASDVLSTIHTIEQQEGLPSPVLAGEWNKTSWLSRSTRLMMHFSEDNIEDCIELAQACGATNIYHPHIFHSWGHFEPRENLFPSGREGVRYCVDRAREAGLIVGVHTLSNFITANDAYVTPTPHPHLAVSGVTTLAASVTATDTEIQLPDDAPIDLYRKQAVEGGYEGPGSHKVLRIGDELIGFDRVSDTQPWTLIDCQRGWGDTVATAHASGDRVSKLISHPYKVFFPDMVLQQEMAENLADFLNETGVERISLDGFEGCFASGHGKFACNRFAEAIFERLNNKSLSLSSSITTNFAWHLLSNESWGEPWTGGFRASHFEYRLNSIETLKNNHLPFKLGQFNFAQASAADLHWLLGFSTGHDAGVDLYISPRVLDRADADEKIQAIRDWTEFRRRQLATPAQRAQLQNPLYEYTISRNEQGELTMGAGRQWKQLDDDQASVRDRLVSIDALVHISRRREPGQPTQSEWTLASPRRQPLHCQLLLPESAKQSLRNPVVTLGAVTITWEGELKPGDYLHIHQDRIEHYRNQQQQSEGAIDMSWLSEGNNVLSLDYSRLHPDQPGPGLKLDVLNPGVRLVEDSVVK